MAKSKNIKLQPGIGGYTALQTRGVDGIAYPVAFMGEGGRTSYGLNERGYMQTVLGILDISNDHRKDDAKTIIFYKRLNEITEKPVCASIEEIKQTCIEEGFDMPHLFSNRGEVITSDPDYTTPGL